MRNNSKKTTYSTRDKKTAFNMPFAKPKSDEKGRDDKKRKSFGDKKVGDFKNRGGYKRFEKKYPKKGKPNFAEKAGEENISGLARLNKYISNSGVCSRREADDLIVAGAVSINGKIITDLSTRVKPT